MLGLSGVGTGRAGRDSGHKGLLTRRTQQDQASIPPLNWKLCKLCSLICNKVLANKAGERLPQILRGYQSAKT